MPLNKKNQDVIKMINFLKKLQRERGSVPRDNDLIVLKFKQEFDEEASLGLVSEAKQGFNKLKLDKKR